MHVISSLKSYIYILRFPIYKGINKKLISTIHNVFFSFNIFVENSLYNFVIVIVAELIIKYKLKQRK